MENQDHKTPVSDDPAVSSYSKVLILERRPDGSFHITSAKTTPLHVSMLLEELRDVTTLPFDGEAALQAIVTFKHFNS